MTVRTTLRPRCAHAPTRHAHRTVDATRRFVPHRRPSRLRCASRINHAAELIEHHRNASAAPGARVLDQVTDRAARRRFARGAQAPHELRIDVHPAPEQRRLRGGHPAPRTLDPGPRYATYREPKSMIRTLIILFGSQLRNDAEKRRYQELDRCLRHDSHAHHALRHRSKFPVDTGNTGLVAYAPTAGTDTRGKSIRGHDASGPNSLRSPGPDAPGRAGVSLEPHAPAALARAWRPDDVADGRSDAGASSLSMLTRSSPAALNS